MAIDKVGGEYIIKGNNTNPALTPSGQSWANLLTQEKYKLWQIANQEAMRQLQTEQLNAKQRQQRVDQLRQDLQRQRASTQQGISALRAHQLDAIGASNTATWKEEQQRGRGFAVSTTAGSGSGSGSGYGGRGKTIDKLKWENTQRENRNNLAQDIEQKINERVRGENSEFVKEAYKKRAEGNVLSLEQDEAIQKYTNQNPELAKALDSQLNRLEQLNNDIEIYDVASEAGQNKIIEDSFLQIGGSGGSGSSSGSGRRTTVRSRTGVKPVTDAPVQDYTPEIERQEKRLRDIEQQLLNLENVEIPVGDAIGGTRRILKTKFGQGNYQEPVAESPAIPTEPVVTQPVSQPEVQPTQETTDELMSQKDAEAYLDNLFASRLTQQGTQQNFQTPKATSVLPQVQPEVQPEVQPRITPAVSAPSRTEQTVVQEILGLDNPLPELPVKGSYAQTRFDEVTGEPIQYGDVTIDGVSVQQDYEDVFRLEQFTPEMAIQNLDSRMEIELSKEGATQQSVADAVQITALKLLDQNSKFRLSDPEKYDKYRDAIFDYVYKLVNPEQAQSFDTAKEIIAGKNLDEMTLYQYVDGATKEDNANMLRILQTNWGSLTNPKDLNDKSKEAYKAIDFAYKNGAITEKQYKTYFSLLTTWTMVGKQLMNKSLAEQDVILDKRFTTSVFGD